jgi:hypothetical protein
MGTKGTFSTLLRNVIVYKFGVTGLILPETFLAIVNNLETRGERYTWREVECPGRRAYARQ